MKIAIAPVLGPRLPLSPTSALRDGVAHRPLDSLTAGSSADVEATPTVRNRKSEDDFTNAPPTGVRLHLAPRHGACATTPRCWIGRLRSTFSSKAWCFHGTARQIESRASYSNFVLPTNFAGHQRLLSCPPLPHCAESAGLQLPWERETFPTCRLAFRSPELDWDGKGLSSLFCFGLRVRAGDVGVSEVVRDVEHGETAKADSDELLWPCLVVLSMGWSWGLVFARRCWRTRWCN